MDITESKQTEKELKESDNRFQQLFNQAPLGYQSLDIDGNFLEVNQKWLEMLGYEREEVIGKWFGDFLTPMYQDGFRKRFPIFKAQGHIHSEFEMQHKNGSVLFIAFEGRIGSDLKGNFKQTHCILQDITESKRANEALIKSREDFLDLFDNAPIGYHEIDAEGRIVRMNQTELNMLGYTLGELVGKQFWSIITEEKVSGKAIVAKLSGEYVPIDFFEREFRKKDGTMLSVLLKDKIFKDKDGHITGIRTTVQNITERKKADNALKESEEKYRRITDNIIDVVWTSDLQLNINYVSPSVRKLLGLTEQEHINRSLAEKFPPESLAKLQQIFKEEYEKEGNPAFDKNHSRCIEVQYYKKDGTLIWAEINVSIIRNEFGVGVGLQGMTRDISDRKKAEEASRESEEIFRNTFENSEVGKSITSIEGELKTNTAFCQILGYSESELSTVNWRKITHLDDIESNSKIVEDLLKGVETSKRWEKRYIHKNGDIVWVDITTTLHRNGLGKPLFFITEIIDINDRKNAESDMQLNARRLNALVNILQYPIDSVQHYLDFALTQAIEMTDSKLGYIYNYNEEKKEFVLNSWSKEVMNECKIMEKQTVYQLDKTGLWGEAVRQRKPIVVNDFQSHHPLKKGQPEGHAQLKNYLTIPVFRNKEIVAVIAVANKGTDYNDSDLKQLSVLMDIVWNTLEKKQAETALKQSEEKFSKAFKSSPDLIMLTEFESGRIVEVNERLFEITGYNEEEFIGKTTNEIHLWSYPEDRERFKNLLRHDGFVHNMEAKLSIKSGELRDNLVSAEIIELQNGKFILGVNRDITELKKVEETLKSSQKLLSETEKLGKVGGWEFYYDSDKLNWTEETFSIHELDYNNELVLDNAISFYTPDSTPIIKSNFQNAIEQGQPFDLELEIITAKGNHRHVHTIGKPDKEHRRIYGFFQDITERKQADIALIESEEKFKKAIMTSPDAINITRSSDGMYVSVSEGFTNMLGYTEEETVGRTSMEMDIWVEVEDLNKLVNGLKENGFVKNLLAQFKKKDGGFIYGLMSANAIELNGVKHILSITRDVTESTKTELALAESKSKLDAALASTTDAIFITDAEGNYIEFNEAFVKFQRFNSKDELPANFNDFSDIIQVYYPNGEAAPKEMWGIPRALRGETATNIEYKLKRKDTDESWVGSYSFSPILDDKGVIVGSVVVARDVTELKLAEKILLESERRFRELLSSVKLLSVILDMDGNIVFCNDYLLNLTKWEKDDILGKNWFENFLPKEVIENVIGVFKKVRDESTVITNYENTVLSKDGREILVEWNNTALYDENAKINGIASLGIDITERRNAENSIRMSKDRLDRAEFASKSGNWELLVGEGKIKASKGAAKVYGVKREEFNYETIKLIPLPEYRNMMNIALKNLIEKDEPYNIEFKIKSVDNKEIKDIHSTAVYDKDRKVVFGVIQDITDRKLAEEKLFKSERMLKTVLDNFPGSVFWKDLNSRYLGSNIEFAMNAGFKNEEKLIGLTDFDFPWAKTEAVNYIEDDVYVMTNNRPKLHILETQHKSDGKDTWIDTSKVPLKDENDKVIGVVGVFTDITDKKNAEDALRESEKKLSTLFASMTEMVALHELVFDPEGNPINYRIIDCNNAYTKSTGIQKKDAIGKLATEVYATDVPPYFEEYSRVAISGESLEYKTYYAPMDKHFLISAVSPSKNKFATITSDITEIEQIQAEIKAKNKQLENYIYAASHDLRSPLVNIQGFSQRLQKQTKEIKETLAQIEMEEGLKTNLTKLTNEAIPNTLNFILSNVTKMDGLINALLQISRTGRIEMNISKIDMNRLFKKIVEHVGFQIAEISAKVTIDDLPECFGDENQLNQLFSNIIGNALKYRNQNKKLEINISAQLHYNRVIYCIADNGIGIATQNVEKIWNVFYRVDSFSPESGDGIGLSLVRTIADKHKGKVWAESEVGIGSRFYIELQSNKFEE